MNFRILKKDLKRKKSINLILLVFIFLSTMFIAGSLYNFTVILNGVDNFLTQAGIGDFLIVTMGGNEQEISENDKNIEEFLKNQKDVTSYTIDNILFLSANQLKKENNKKILLDNTMILNCFDIEQQKFFDKNNQEITQMEDATIYISQRMAAGNHLKIGDKVKICCESGYEVELKVAGELKDALLGSDMMGTQRCVINSRDFQEVLKKGNLPFGRLYSIFCKDLNAFQIEYNNGNFNEIFGADRMLVKTTYILEMVIAAVILLVSICLIAISVLMLKFTIVFTVNEDYKEIGIMKAIGMKDSAIRRLYMIKYFVLAAIGALFGFMASIPFSTTLLLQVTQKIVIKSGRTGILFQFVTSVLIVGIIVLFGYLSTGKIKKFSPMDAIRSGNNGERFQKKGLFHLKNSHVRPTTFLAYNDVLCEIKKYFILFLTSVIGVWLVIMPVNTINTLKSDGIAAWFGLTDCDFYIRDEEKVAELIGKGTKQEWYHYLEDTKQLFERNGIEVEKVCTEVYFKLRVRKENKSYKSFAIQGLGTSTEQYFYDEGYPPIYENEVAITHVIAEKIDAKLGDTIYITSEEQEKPYLISAIYQSMNNMGEGIRFTAQAELDYNKVSGGFGAQIILQNEKDREKLSDIIEQVKKLMPKAKIETVGEFISGMIGNISGRLDSLKLLILIVVAAINILVVMLMQKMFLIRERGEMGMLKSIGFSNGAVIRWQTKRMILVQFFGILIGIFTGVFFSEITAGQVFKIMGAKKIEFVINPLEIYVIYPAVLFLVTILACMLTMQKVRNVSIQEMNNME